MEPCLLLKRFPHPGALDQQINASATEIPGLLNALEYNSKQI